jgi:hypothetical protein
MSDLESGNRLARQREHLAEAVGSVQRGPVSVDTTVSLTPRTSP